MTITCHTRGTGKETPLPELSLDPIAAADIEKQLGEANLRLARNTEVPKDIEKLIQSLSLQVIELPPQEEARVDPYLLVSLQQGVIAALRAFDISKETLKRRQLRIALERMRQAFRDIVEGVNVSEDQSTKDVVRWLVDTLDVPQGEVADILDVHPRKLQRWLSATDPSEPHDEDALRVRLVARITNHLRHGFSGPGVVAWLERPHPELKGQAPKDLLSKRQTFEHLASLASAARSSAAT